MYSPNPNYWDCYLKPLLSNYIKVQYSSDGLKIIFRCYFLLIFGKSPLPSSLRWQKEITNNECHYQIGDRTCRNEGMKTQTFHLCYLLYPYYFYYWLLSRYILSFSFSIHTFHLKKKMLTEDYNVNKTVGWNKKPLSQPYVLLSCLG